VLYQPDETIRLEVRMGDDTVWLTQAQMAELFDKDRTVIGRHIRNIYQEEELERNITCAKFAHMGTDGDQIYEYTAYNLDVIISVGYRVKSKRGTKFRQWANKVLKEYLLRGYAMNSRLLSLEQHLAQHDKEMKQIKEKVDFFVRTALPPIEGIFYDGQVFDAYRFASDLIRKAKHSIVLIDNYVDDTVLTLLDKRAENVTATIYTQHISQQLQLDINRHNTQYPAINVEHFNRAHDRFLLIDDEVYHIGASIKDLGKKWFAFTLMQYVTDNFTFRNLGIYICLSTGMRIGEVCALKWSDIDLGTETIHVNRTIERIYIIEGDKRRTELVIGTPKTKNSIREIPVSKELMKLIRPLKKLMNDDYFVITNEAKPTEPRTYRNYYKQLLKQLGIPDLKFHGLRHSFATRCIESQCDYKTVSVILGHANISTTLNLYVHPNMDQKKKCINKMFKSLK